MKVNFESERIITVLSYIAGFMATLILILPAWLLVKDKLSGNDISSYYLFGLGCIAAYCLVTSAMVCNVGRAILGLLIAVAAAGLGLHSSWWAMALYTWLFISILAGFFVTTYTYGGLESRHKKKPSNEKQVAKCSKCHAKSFCPYQPGGIMDEYKT